MNVSSDLLPHQLSFFCFFFKDRIVTLSGFGSSRSNGSWGLNNGCESIRRRQSIRDPEPFLWPSVRWEKQRLVFPGSSCDLLIRPVTSMVAAVWGKTNTTLWLSHALCLRERETEREREREIGGRTRTEECVYRLWDWKTWMRHITVKRSKSFPCPHVRLPFYSVFPPSSGPLTLWFS